uniref:Uncharacterized protein n=1 Tax=Rhizophora mucronata TaxID=61149 RepID=A0A2P2KEH0_RHIMU
MGKLGKKARKFAKKNLQSVLKKKRKIKSLFKKRAAKRVEFGEDVDVDMGEKSIGRNPEVEDFEETVLGTVFGEDDSDLSGDDSESDGYLSEDTSFTPMDESENGSHQEGMKADSSLLVQKREIHLELAEKMKKLEKLKDKVIMPQILAQNVTF